MSKSERTKKLITNTRQDIYDFTNQAVQTKLQNYTLSVSYKELLILL